MAVYVEVRGTFVDLQGRPARGSVVFTARPERIFDEDTNNFLVPLVQTASLDSGGAISISLPASDDSSLIPTGWSYQVTEKITGLVDRVYDIQLSVDDAVSGIDLSDLAPVVGSVGAGAGAFARIQRIVGSGAWQPYTPVWTINSGTNPQVGNGTLTGAYLRFGDLIFYEIVLTIGTTTTPGVETTPFEGWFEFTLPVPGVTPEIPMGSFNENFVETDDFFPEGGGYVLLLPSLSKMQFGSASGLWGSAVYVDQMNPAPGGQLLFAGSYRAAP